MDDYNHATKFFGLPPMRRAEVDRAVRNWTAHPDQYRARWREMQVQGWVTITGEDGIDATACRAAWGDYDPSLAGYPEDIPDNGTLLGYGIPGYVTVASSEELGDPGTLERAQSISSLLITQIMRQMNLARELLDLTSYNWHRGGRHKKG